MPIKLPKITVLIRVKALSNNALKLSKMKRLLISEYHEFWAVFFERKRKEYLKQKRGFTKSLLSNEKLLKASCLIGLRVTRTKSSHPIAENLTLPPAVDVCEVVWDSRCAAKLKEIPLSINTISRKIGDVSHDIRSQLLERLNKTYFAI